MKDVLGKFLLQWRLNIVLPHINGRLLDIGCGTNELVRRHVGKGIGVDVYDWGDVDCVVEDTSKLPFANEEFDTVSIVAALNHIPNREDVLKEAYRCLRPNGKMLVTMIPPAISFIWHTLRRPWDVDQKERGMKKGEVYGLSREQIHSLLESARFTVISDEYFMFGFNLLTIAIKPN